MNKDTFKRERRKGKIMILLAVWVLEYRSEIRYRGFLQIIPR